MQPIRVNGVVVIYKKDEIFNILTKEWDSLV